MRKQSVSGAKRSVAERYVISTVHVFEHKVTMAQGVFGNTIDLYPFLFLATNIFKKRQQKSRILLDTTYWQDAGDCF